MNIVYVIDSYGEFSNGTTVTAKRSKQFLEKLGHKVSIVSISDNDEEGFFKLEERKIPIVSYFAKKQSMYFAKPNKEVFKEAFKDADLVHLFLPYKSSRVALKVAKKMNIPVTAAFHMQPEHITYGMGLDRFGKPLSYLIYKWLNFRFYKNITHIHCPSEFIRDSLKKHKYKNVFHVISNGISKSFFTNPKRDMYPEIFNVLTIGRYSKEKRQDTLLKAVNYSKYKSKIHITVAGKGPKEKRLKKLVKKYNLNASFKFLSKEELIKTIKESHLYIHPAEAEIEGISALEAISSGLVPIVAESKHSATSKFTLTKESLYKVRNYKELAKKIDYFIENGERRIELEDLYREHMNNYEMSYSMKLLEEMFKQAISDHKRKKSSNSKKAKNYKRKIKKNKIKRFLSSIFYYGIAFPILSIYFYLIRGLKVKGKKNIRKLNSGAVVISNHVHKLDSVMNAIAVFPKKLNFTSIPSNFEIPVYGSIVSAFGASPIPINTFETKVFLYELRNKLTKGKFVHFFPEGDLISGYNGVRNFKRGAFVLSEEAKVPVIPVKITSINKSIYKYPFFFKSKIKINIGEPIYPNIFSQKRESINELRDKAFNELNKLK